MRSARSVRGLGPRCRPGGVRSARVEEAVDGLGGVGRGMLTCGGGQMGEALEGVSRAEKRAAKRAGKDTANPLGI